MARTVWLPMGMWPNKIGSYMLALAANDNRWCRFYSVFPISTVDIELENGGRDSD